MPHVWFVEASSDTATLSGSAVAVCLQKTCQPATRSKYLLTCAHNLRGTAPDGVRGYGSLLRNFRVWGPDCGYNDDVALDAEVAQIVRPIETGVVPKDQRIAADDWAVLRLPDSQASNTIDTVTEWADSADGNLQIWGYPAGVGAFAMGLVQPTISHGFTFHGSDCGVHRLTGTETRWGMSGGGVFDANGRLLGIHRARIDEAVQCHAISIAHIREGLAKQEYELVARSEEIMHRVWILHASHDQSLADEVISLAKDTFSNIDHRLAISSILPNHINNVRPQDFLIVLYSPIAHADRDMRFLLGMEANRRNKSAGETIDAILLCGGAIADNVSALNEAFRVYETTELDRLGSSLEGWVNDWSGGFVADAAIAKTWKPTLNQELYGATRLLTEVAVKLPVISQTHPVSMRYIYHNARDLNSGVVQVVHPRKIYEHDADAIRKMKQGDAYLATHPIEANAGAHENNTDSHTAYEKYIAAQIEAAGNGVTVSRIYILPPAASLLSREFERHFQEMVRLRAGGITISLLSADNRAIRRDQAQDFVIFGEDCVGIGQPESGPMWWSDYHVGTDDTVRGKIEAYRNYFDDLEGEATLFGEDQPTTNKTPAFVNRTKIRISQESASRSMVVLRTGGCAYDKNNSGCTMCDFKRHAIRNWNANEAADDLLSQLDFVLRKPGHEGVQQLDLLVLGSFLDRTEIPEEFCREAFARIAKHESIKRVLVESRVSHIKVGPVGDLKKMLRADQTLEIGIGVESSNKFLRNNVLRKGLKWSELARAVGVIAEAKAQFVAYLLIGPHTLSEDEAREDAVRSAKDVAELAREAGLEDGQWRIAFEPVFVTSGTVLEKHFLDGLYTPVNLWTIVSVLKKTFGLCDLFVGLSDEGLSSEDRRPKGCSECTPRVRDAIEEFNGTNDLAIFDAEDIKCTRCRPGHD